MNRLRKLAYRKPAIIKNRATCYRGAISSKEYAEVQYKRALFLNVRFGLRFQPVERPLSGVKRTSRTLRILDSDSNLRPRADVRPIFDLKYDTAS